MRKTFVLLAMLLVVSAPAFANLLVNGDFETGPTGTNGTVTGWTFGKSSWSDNFSDLSYDVLTGTDTSVPSGYPGTWPGFTAYSGGSLYFATGHTVFGWYYQKITGLQVGQQLRVTGMWDNWGHGETSGLDFWAQVAMFNSTGADMTSQLDPGVQGTPGVVAKRDIHYTSTSDWTNATCWSGGTPNVWEPISNYQTANGNTLVVDANGAANGVVVACMVANSANSAKRSRAGFDNMDVEIVPEPGSMVAMFGGLIGLAAVARRKR